MSVVYLHFGQCGIQIGEELWLKSLSHSLLDDHDKHVMFSTKLHPRAIFCDAEKKVLNNFHKRLKSVNVSIYEVEFIICSKHEGKLIGWCSYYDQVIMYLMYTTSHYIDKMHFEK